MSLQVSHRPKDFKDIVGNKEVVKSLKSVLYRKKKKLSRTIPSAFLITGPSGTGKTTIGRIIKNVLNCSDADYSEYDNADDRSIESIRRMKDNLKYSPLDGDKKVILMDEVHMLMGPPQNALLKILEEPPSYAHIILCTTNPEKLLPTIKRRCHQYEVSLLLEAEMNELLDKVLKKEKVKKFSKEVKEKIIDLADGSPGQALKLLDQVIDMKDKKEAIQTLQSMGVSEKEIKDLCQALIKGNISATKEFLNAFKTGKTEAESVRLAVLGYMNTVMVNRWDERTAFIIDQFMESFIYSGKAGLTNACYYALKG